MISLVKFTLLPEEFISRKTKVSPHTCYKHYHLLIELINFLLKLTLHRDQLLYWAPKIL